MLRTPLYEEHKSLGANFTDFGGWEMPVRYGSDLDEHHAVRSSAGIFDISHMSEFSIVGDDAARFLDYAVVTQVSKLAVGKAKYTMICREDGGVIDDLIVYETPQPQTAPLKLALQYPSPTPATCPADSSEANNTPATATTLTVGSALTNRNFHTAADEDWYIVALSGGLRYRLSAAVAAGSDADPVLELYARDGVTLLASNDNVAADQHV